MSERTKCLQRLANSIEKNEDGLPKFPDDSTDSSDAEGHSYEDLVPYGHAEVFAYPDNVLNGAEFKMPEEDHERTYQGDEELFMGRGFY